MRRPTIQQKGTRTDTMKAIVLDALNGSEPLVLRDRAVLEVMYGCGLRVAELAAMTTSDTAAGGFIRIVGKGHKQRAISPLELRPSTLSTATSPTAGPR